MLYSLETYIIAANNVDSLHTLSEMTTMARSKTRTILDNTRINAWWDNVMGNSNMVSERKENFRLSQSSTTRSPIFLAVLGTLRLGGFRSSFDLY